MKASVALALALSTLVSATAAQAQERPLFLYSGSSSAETPAATLRGAVPATVEAPVARKVRVVLQSPYGN